MWCEASGNGPAILEALVSLDLPGEQYAGEALDAARAARENHPSQPATVAEALEKLAASYLFGKPAVVSGGSTTTVFELASPPYRDIYPDDYRRACRAAYKAAHFG